MKHVHDTEFMSWLHDLIDHANDPNDRCYMATSNKTLQTFSPSSGNPIGEVELSSEYDYFETVVEARLSMDAWKSTPAPVRGEFVRRLGSAFRDNKQMLGRLISFEMGKILQEGLGEVQEMIDVADFAVGQSRMMYGKTMHSERPNHRMYEQWHPYGIVGVISAFNFPMAVWAWNACIAAICGNVVIWKPSSKTPLCAIAVQRICDRVMQEMGIQPTVMQLILPENHEVAQLMVDDPNIPLISFTGSSTVGKQIAQDVAKRMGKTIMECSGNNAIIVTEHANLDLVTPAVVFGAVGTAGQRCTTTRRLIVHEDIADAVMARLIPVYKQLKIGSPLDEEIHVGPLIDNKAVAQFKRAVARAKTARAEIKVGGIALKTKGVNCVQPTIIMIDTLNDEQLACTKDEVFAPILYVMTYRNLDDAIELQNDVPQGLSSAIFTDNIQQAERFLSALGSDCGIANVNIGTSGSEVGAGFGGHKDTGHGDEAGPESWKQYMRRQVCVINHGTTLPLAQGIKFDI